MTIFIFRNKFPLLYYTRYSPTLYQEHIKTKFFRRRPLHLYRSVFLCSVYAAEAHLVPILKNT